MKKPPADKPPTPEAELRSCIERFGPTEQKLIRSIRSALRKRFPTANELAYDYRTFIVIAYSPTEHGIDGVVSFAARPDGMRLYLTHGPQLPDPGKLLQGSGKQVRFVTLESARDLARPDVKALVEAAIGLATVHLPAKGKGKLIIRSSAAKKPARARRPK